MAIPAETSLPGLACCHNPMATRSGTDALSSLRRNAARVSPRTEPQERVIRARSRTHNTDMAGRTRPLWVVVLIALSAACRPPVADFGRRHAEALNATPPDVQLTLRTSGGRTTFNLFETIPIELAFSSSRPGAFSIEVDAMNAISQQFWFVVDRPMNVLKTRMLGDHGYVCCSSQRPNLGSEPIVLRHDLTDYIRFDQSGPFEVYFTTRRVFRGHGNQQRLYESASEFATTSSALVLTILPDDPEWNARRLADVLSRLDDPPVKNSHHQVREYAKHGLEVPSTARHLNDLFEQAQRALNLLDTPSAIDARVSRMWVQSYEDWRQQRVTAKSSRGYTISPQPLLASTTRPDRVAAALESRARGSEFGVERDFADVWVKMLVQRDHRELFLATPDNSKEREERNLYATFWPQAVGEVVGVLESALPAKLGVAREMTADTIGLLREYSERSKKPEAKGRPQASRRGNAWR